MTDIPLSNITLRPSSLSSFLSCPWEWYNVFILGKRTIPGARAMIGTGIHKGVEVMWRASMTHNKKDDNLQLMQDAGVAAYDDDIERAEGAVTYDDEIVDDNEARKAVCGGLAAYRQYIIPQVQIPAAVETWLCQPLNHCRVAQIAGTLDYVSGDGQIHDIKTSKRKISTASHILQQSMYRILAENNGITVTANMLQGVILGKKGFDASLDSLDPHTARTRVIVNTILDKLDLVEAGHDPRVVFSGNPMNFLCNPRYCGLYDTCRFVRGDE